MSELRKRRYNTIPTTVYKKESDGMVAWWIDIEDKEAPRDSFFLGFGEISEEDSVIDICHWDEDRFYTCKDTTIKITYWIPLCPPPAYRGNVKEAISTKE